MGLITSSQADACTIVRMEKVVSGSDTSWIVGVNDADGNYYDMALSGLGSDPTKSDIKTAVAAELIKRPKQPAPVVETITPVEDKGLGETLG
tara:strand:+ start:6111 stop:6386 length:276 start_codon:yes stop_codon:yes gene_type:complete